MKRNNANDSNIAKRQRGCEAEESEDEFEDLSDQFDEEKVVETVPLPNQTNVCFFCNLLFCVH